MADGLLHGGQRALVGKRGVLLDNVHTLAQALVKFGKRRAVAHRKKNMFAHGGVPFRSVWNAAILMRTNPPFQEYLIISFIL